MTPDEARTALQESDRCFLIEDAKNLAEIAGGNRDDCIEPGSVFHNVFFYEMRPSVLIAEYSNFDKIKFMEKNERHDVEFFSNNADVPVFVECTSAIDGHHDALVMEHMNIYGRAPAYQKIEYTGTKNNRVINETDPMCTKAEERNQEFTLPLMTTAIKKKIDKARQNTDYFGAILSVVFDDWCAPYPEEKPKRFDKLCCAAISQNSAGAEIFSNVFIVGTSGAYLFDGQKNASVILPKWT